MKRFLVFPLTRSVAGAVTVVLCLMQAVWPIALQLSSLARTNYLFQIYGLTDDVVPYAFMGGLWFGCGLAMWDKLRNRHDQSSTTRLTLNLWWCGTYALVLNALTGAISASIFNQIAVGTDLWWVFGVPLVQVTTFNCAAILWAAIRSVTANDVLSPRVLLAKTREWTRVG